VLSLFFTSLSSFSDFFQSFSPLQASTLGFLSPPADIAIQGCDVVLTAASGSYLIIKVLFSCLLIVYDDGSSFNGYYTSRRLFYLLLMAVPSQRSIFDLSSVPVEGAQALKQSLPPDLKPQQLP
jgi:hypothetical protein